MQVHYLPSFLYNFSIEGKYLSSDKLNNEVNNQTLRFVIDNLMVIFELQILRKLQIA